MYFQINLFFDSLEQLEANVDRLSDHIFLVAAPFIHEIDILTSMNGVSVLAAAAVMSDIVSVDRFEDS